MRGWSIFVLFFILISLPLVPIDAVPSQGTNESDYSSSYSIHGPINITCNEDFIIQGWNGTGSSEDPFLISGLNITSDSNCISVSNTTAFFLVTDCLLTSETRYLYSFYEDPVGVGLYLRNVSNCKIESCYINWKYYGIVSSNSSECSFSQNVIYANMWDGLRFSEAKYSNISGNGIFDNSANGIYIIDSPFTNIDRNSIHGNNYYGLSVISSDNSTFTNNEMNENQDGFFVLYSDYVDILNNIISGGMMGLALSQERNLRTINNTIQNVEGHAIALTYIESSIFEKNLVASNHIGYMIEDCIQCNFSENSLLMNDRGITALEITDCIFTNNTISANHEYAIWLDQNSTDNAIYWNILSGSNDFLGKDDGLRNLWDDNVSLGNSWSDYQGFGVYAISGMTGSVDRYPQGYQADPMPLLIVQGLGLTGICTVLILGAYHLVIKKRQLGTELMGSKPP